MKLDLYFKKERGKTVVDTAKSTFKVGPNEKEKMKLMRDMPIFKFIDYGIEVVTKDEHLVYSYWTRDYEQRLDFSDENGVICSMTSGYPLGDIVEKLVCTVGENKVSKILLDSIKKTYEYQEKESRRASHSEVCL